MPPTNPRPAAPAVPVPKTAAQALEAFGRDRLARCGESWQPALESALDVIAGFCDAYGPRLLDAIARRRVGRRRAAAATAGRDLLEPLHLARALVPCAALFPYHIVAGAGVLQGFRGEVPRLSRWLAHHRLATPETAAGFRQAWPALRATIERLQRLQDAIENALENGMPPETLSSDVMVGHFRIERAERVGLWVVADGESHGPVRFPHGVPKDVVADYVPGLEVSMACARAVVGWKVLATSLPVATDDLRGMVLSLVDGRAGEGQ